MTMGCWGMGMAQTDEFCETYDNFMEEYDEGKPVAEITAGILAKYHAEFDDDDGIMHDVYFALAKAEWMCREQSEAILARVKEIIETKANIEFYRELEATEEDLNLRQRNLQKFWSTLQVPREKARKRKRVLAVEKALPPVEIGDCFAYKYAEGFRVICILERFRPKPESEETVSVALFCNVYDAPTLKKTDFTEETVGKLFTVTASEFLGKSLIRRVAHIPIPNTQRSFFNTRYESKPSFREEIAKPLGLTLREILWHYGPNTEEAFAALEVGGCYAYQYKNGYRFAVVLDRAEINEEQHLMIAVLSAFSETPDTDFLHTALSSLALYGKDSLPNLNGWQKVGSVTVPSDMKKRFLGKNRAVINGILDFFWDESDMYLSLNALHRLAPIFSYCRENTDEGFAKLKTYGLYSYPTDHGSRFALILDRFLSSDGTECVLVALLRNASLYGGDYINYLVSHVGIYTSDTLPNTEEWELVNRLIPADYVPDNIKAYLARYGTVKDECIQNFFLNGLCQTIQGMLCTLKNFLRTDFTRL